MHLPRHTASALDIYGRLDSLGLNANILYRIGAFAVSWGLFETSLERAVWTLTREQVSGTRPSTDKTNVSDWIATLGSGRNDLSQKANRILEGASKAADNLAHYRNSLFHGHLIAVGGTPWFMRNPRWHGENRKRPTGDAQVEENLLDLANDSAWTLFQVARKAGELDSDAESSEALEALASSVEAAISGANELRYLAEMMNHEKY